MDENVVFNSGQPNNQSSQPPVGEADTDPQQATPAEPAEGVDGEQLETTEEEEYVAPAGPLDFFKAHWWKFLVGILLLFFILFLINLFSPKKAVTENVKLSWWGLWEDGPAMQAIIVDFEKEYPHIDIEYSKRSPQDYYEKVLSRIENGTGPDIFRYHNSWVPVLSDKLLPLPVDVIDPKEFKNNYYTVVQKDLMKNNAILGIPMGIDSLAMLTNTELFANAGVNVPGNWNEFKKVAKQLTVKDAVNGKIKQAGAALGTYKNVQHAPDIISLLYMQQGINLYTFEGKPENKASALQFYTDFAKGTDNVWDETLDNSLLAFSKGTLAIYFGYSWDVLTIQKLNKNIKFKVSPAPMLTKPSTIASYWVEGVSAKSKHQQEALLFMKHLAKKETAQKFYAETGKGRAFGEPYARKDMRESLREEPLIYPFLAQLDEASSTIFSSDTHDGDTGLNTTLNKYLENATNSVLYDGDTLQSINETIESGVAQVFKNYGITKQ